MKKLIDEDGAVVARGGDWGLLAFDAYCRMNSPIPKLLLAASWWVADVHRMEKADVGTLERWLTGDDGEICWDWAGCPFDPDDGGQELEFAREDGFFQMASELWFICTRNYTRLGMLRAIRRAAREPILELEDLVRRWAREAGLTLVVVTD